MSDEAFLENYKNVEKSLRKFIKSKIIDDDAADDIFQDTILILFEKNNSNIKNHTAFMIGIAKNKIKQYYDYNKQYEQLQDAESIEAPNIYADDYSYIVDELPGKYKKVLSLIVDNYSPECIAETLNLPIETIYKRIQRAKQLVQRLRNNNHEFHLV